MALRLSREAALLDDSRAAGRGRDAAVGGRGCWRWPHARTPSTPNPIEAGRTPEAGDDDAEDELDAFDEDDFYADALEDA